MTESIYLKIHMTKESNDLSCPMNQMVKDWMLLTWPKIPAYVFMSVSHHHMVVGRTLEDATLAHHAEPLSSKGVAKFFGGVVALDPQPHVSL